MMSMFLRTRTIVFVFVCIALAGGVSEARLLQGGRPVDGSGGPSNQGNASLRNCHERCLLDWS